MPGTVRGKRVRSLRDLRGRSIRKKKEKVTIHTCPLKPFIAHILTICPAIKLKLYQMRVRLQYCQSFTRLPTKKTASRDLCLRAVQSPSRVSPVSAWAIYTSRVCFVLWKKQSFALACQVCQLIGVALKKRKPVWEQTR